MPVIKSAKKKLRQDKKREKLNSEVKLNYKKAIKEAQKSKTLAKVTEAVKLIDKASKKGILHKNKVARLKSKLSKIAKPSTKTKTVNKPKKISVKNTK